MYSVEKVLSFTTGENVLSNGKEHYIHCPFHKEHTPSFQMDYRGRFICFGCGVHGHSIVDYICKLYNVTDFDPTSDEFDALDILANASIKPIDLQEYQREPITDEQAKINLVAAKDYYDGNFYDDPTVNKNYARVTPGFNYMYSRGFLSETLHFFHVVDWQLFHEHPLFIPLQLNGDVYGYQQRKISSTAFPKYLSMLGQKSNQHLHGFYTKGARRGIVSEGTLDIMMTWQYGWRTAAFAIIGSHVSEKQAELLSEYCDVYISGFDNDTAGEEAHKSFVVAMQPYDKRIIRLQLACQGLSLATKKQFLSAVTAVLKLV